MKSAKNGTLRFAKLALWGDVAATFSLIFLGLVASLSPGKGQEETAAKSGPPRPPYVGMLSGNYSFTKKYLAKPQQENANLTQEQKDLKLFYSRFPVPQEMESKQFENLRWDKMTYTSGLSTETWRAGNYRLTSRSTSPGAVSILSASQTGYKDSIDFQELEWVSKETYQGEQTLQDKPCYVYKQADQTVWIDKQTKLPLAYESSSLQINYTYREMDQPLRLPEGLALKLQAVKGN